MNNELVIIKSQVGGLLTIEIDQEVLHHISGQLHRMAELSSDYDIVEKNVDLVREIENIYFNVP